MDIKEIREGANEPITDSDLDYLLDVFSGADGGIGFVNLRRFVDTLKDQADNGDHSAEELIQILRKFTKLVRIGTRLR